MADEITLDAPETRIERFLAAAAGVEGITLDEPETRIEKYLYKIAQGSGGVPAVEDADKGKYLHANESTGALEWAEGGGSGGGGVLVVNAEYDGESTYTLDKTWQECKDAELVSVTMEGTNTFCIGVSEFENIITHQTEYYVLVYDFKNESPVEFKTATASGYPSETME